METLWGIAIFKTIMVIAYKKVCICAPIFNLFMWTPQIFPLGANLYKKLPFSAILGAVRPHFKSDSHT